ncbi:ferritin-like domain-containing protein [Coleofasciculus sp. FACHB-1120]|uniref:ferritin-like domain-containing protein n=1 Tax=Coleofasciculus sp. FACHB-1120 TaxID=2692783 RepID=UPI00168829C0|nr:ferritin-like domain-containing protein [Coleofasciculus sp. FACHB-1120]MBD2740307.1 ferritin-like domain-containing protein [Coleofasciculus sp. FACHB-1120]
MNQYQKTAGFDLPHLQSDDRLRRVLSSALKSRLGNDPVSPKFMSNSYWDAAHFNLEKVQVFQDSSQQEQAEILRLCSDGLIEEAYFIEKAGVGYMAKMVLLAETTEERMLYALFSSDEVTHLAQISRFLPEKDLVGTDDPFLRFLADLVETQDKTVLLFVLQVVLEGWGLSHYRSLAKNCVNPQMAAIFEGFLQDESRHHGTGVTLFNQIYVSQASRATIIETLALFLQMVQVGPRSVVTAIEQVKGHLSRQQRLRIFQELDTETHSGIRLNLLRSLMRGEAAGIIVQELEEQGRFQPFPVEQCL